METGAEVATLVTAVTGLDISIEGKEEKEEEEEEEEKGGVTVSLLGNDGCSREEEELLLALRMKAEAYADKGWESYWAREGPRLLAAGWREAQPNVSLARVETVCGVGFLCDATTGGGGGMEEGGRGEGEGVGEAEEGGGFAVAGGEAAEEACPMHETAGLVEGGSHDHSAKGGTALEDDAGVVMVTEGGVALTNEDVVGLWMEHYNGFYWSNYDCYRRLHRQVSGRCEVGV